MDIGKEAGVRSDVIKLAMRFVLIATGCLVLLATSGCTSRDEKTAAIPAGGRTEWVEVPGGRVKTRIYASPRLSERPVLILALHGDLPNPAPSYQFFFAQAVTEGFSSVTEMPKSVRDQLGADLRAENVIAAGMLRPGYADATGDRSSGTMGAAVGDNYTPEVVDATAAVVRHLRTTYKASAVILVGHSGGATISANLLGRHPGLVEGALLVACGCDPVAWRARMNEQQPNALWDGPTPSLLPLSLSNSVDRATRVRLLVGDRDDVALPEYSQAYADALRSRGVDVQLTIEPGLGHNILFTAPVFRELGALIGQVERALPR